MVANLFPYPEYRESIVPWLDRVPEHWQTRQLRTLASEPIRNGVGESAQPFRPDWPRYIRITDIAGPRALRTNTRASLPLETAAGARVKEGDLLLAAVGATYGKSYLHRDVGTPACFAGYLVRLSPNAEVSPEFLSYWTESAAYWDQLNSQVIQSTIQNFSAGRYKGLRVPLPPLEEQAAIVRFLEYADRRIRRFIAAKKELIALLNEQKRAIIHRAVTRGLDPSVRLKPSGVEWLGAVPEHWEVMLNQRIFKEQIRPHGGHPEVQLSLSQRDGLVATSDMQERSLQTSTFENWKVTLPGDLVLNRFKAHLGVFFASTLRGIVSFHYGVFAPRRPIVTKYFELLYHTNPYRVMFAVRSNGVTVGLQNLSNQNFYNVRSVVPPVEEQAEIVSFALGTTERLSDAMGILRREIDLLREYRTRLVADVVTGKVDVRGAAARLPTESDEPAPLEDMDAVADDDESGDADLDAVLEQAEA